jgi:hypothetical protein
MFDFYSANIALGILKVLLVLLPIPLSYIAYIMWHHYVSEDFVAGIEWQLLEIIIPQTITKTPLAMETILANAMYHKSQKGLWEEYWQGAVPFFFSLEIVSIEGKIHFFVNTPSRVAPLIKSQIYAQYPQAKVLEVDDYVWGVPTIGKKTGWSMWGCEWTLERPDPFPIKTYVDYGLDKVVKDPSEQVDPVVSMVEFFSTLGPGEQMWMQLIIRFTKKTYPAGSHHGWDFFGEADRVLQEMVEPYTEKKLNEDGSVQSMQVRPPDYLKDEITSISDKQHKLCFDCGLRTIYLARTEIFDQQKRRALRMMFRQYNTGNFNSLKRINSTQYDSPWEDPFDLVLTKRKNRMLDWYRFRVFFHPPWQHAFKYPFPMNLLVVTDPPQMFVLNTEEIATLYHFPAGVTSTPSIKRVETRTSKAPTNLPT